MERPSQRLCRLLEPLRQHLVTISKMKAPDGNPEMGGVHMGASAAWLNGTGPLTGQANYTVIRSKKSIDQYIADKVAEDTSLRSLQEAEDRLGLPMLSAAAATTRCLLRNLHLDPAIPGFGSYLAQPEGAVR